MFDLGEDMELYEKKLLLSPLFETTSIGKNKLMNDMIKEYSWLSEQSGSLYNVTSFRELLQEYQNPKKKRAKKTSEPSVTKLIQGLYQLFWFETSPGKVKESDKPGELIYSFNIDTRYYNNRTAGSFFNEFARHIYTKSFKI
jgi:hypothetical protein